MILSSSLVENHNLVAESIFGTSQNMGLGGVWRVPGRMSGWCLCSVWGEGVWGGRVWDGTVGCLGVPGRCLGVRKGSRGCLGAQVGVWGVSGGSRGVVG